MLRLCRIGYVTIKNVPPAGLIKLGTGPCNTSKQYRSILQRFYSKKDDKGKLPDIQKVQFKSDPTKVPPALDPAPYHIPHQGPSAYQACKTPNLYDQVPSPSYPWGPMVAAYDKKNRTLLIIGIIMFLSSIFIIYYITDFDKKTAPKGKDTDDKCHRRKRVPVIKDPKRSSEIPKSIPYLLIGGGTASFSAFRAIKSADPYAKVLVIGNENYHPYMRPPLSKEIWFDEEDEASKLVFKQWNGSERSLFYEPPDFYMNPRNLLKNENGGVSVARGWTVTSLDVENKTATLDDGYVIEYEKCLIATGARPKNLDIFTKAPTNIREKVTTYRDICDFEELREIAKEVKSLVIIGGGFLGSELACSLARFSKKNNAATISQVFREAGSLGKILPQYLSEWTMEKVKAEGVNVLPNTEIVDVNLNDDNRLVLALGNGKELIVDHAVVAIGVQPNTDLAESADLEVDPEQGGYLVNTELQARTNLYIAGDCACFYDPRLGRRRVEHHDHAVVTGRLAGENMTGAAKPYVHQSMLWSDLGPEVGFEAIGVVDSRLPTVGVFAKCTTKDTPQAVVENTDESDRSLTEQNAPECPPSILNSNEQQEDNYGKGVVFYLRDGVIVGIVLWNVFNRMQVARQVLKEERKYDDLNEVAKLFNIHED